ncbi:type II toxin-antitoxin system VapC family toxin [Rhizobium sp. BR 362]
MNPIRLVPATCVLEARMVLVSRKGEHALAEVDLWLKKIEADIITVDADLVDLATEGWMTYGKGRHPAALDFADCFSYALANAPTTRCCSSARILPRPISRRRDDRRHGPRQ